MLAEILGHVNFNPAAHPSEQVRHRLSPPGHGISGHQDVHPAGTPWVSRGDWGRSQLWEHRDWEQTLSHCTIPAHNAKHATFGNPGTVQQASPALQAVLNSSGNRFGERSDRKGFISHPLPSSACAWLTLSVLSEAGSHRSPRLALLLARHKQTQQQLSCTAPRTRKLSLNSLAQDLLKQEQATQ